MKLIYNCHSCHKETVVAVNDPGYYCCNMSCDRCGELSSMQCRTAELFKASWEWYRPLPNYLTEEEYVAYEQQLLFLKPVVEGYPWDETIPRLRWDMC